MIQDAGAVKIHNVVADGGGVPHNDGAVDTIVNSTAAELGAVTGDRGSVDGRVPEFIDPPPKSPEMYPLILIIR